MDAVETGKGFGRTKKNTCCVHAPILQDECNYYVSYTHSSEKVHGFKIDLTVE